MEYQMKMLPHHYEALKQCLVSDTAVEQGCFALCTESRGKKHKSILVKEIIPLLPDDFVVQEELQLSVSPETMLRVARKAQKNNLSVCMVHTHPMCDGYVEFSEADDFGNLRSFPFFHRMLPGLPHSCLVWDKSLKTVSGRIYDDQNSWVRIDKVEVIGDLQQVNTTGYSDENISDKDAVTYQRQAPLLGEEGQKVLQKYRVGIIGFGGLGACENIIVVHSGFKLISGIDFDHLEEHNRPRIPTATVDDVKNEILKVIVGQNYAENYDCDIEFVALPYSVEAPEMAEYLKDCDALVATTDNTRSRAFLNQFCQQHYIPLLDIGVQFVADDNGHIVNDVGKVNLILPGTACLQCSMHIDPDRLRAESLPEEQRESEIDEGYIRGIDVEQPSMMMFNMQVAARGAQYLTAYFTGLFPIEYERYERYSFLGCNGQPPFKFVKKVQDKNCYYCCEDSMYLGAGDSLPMMITPLDETEVKHHA